jgi:hypothetical protein
MPIFKFCAVCDEVRLEKDTNKSFIIGFYGMLPHVDIAVPSPSQPIAKLSFFFMSGVPVKAGHYDVRIQVLGPDQQALPFETLAPLTLDAIEAPLNVTFTAQPLVLIGTGSYRIIAFINGQEDFTESFFISQGDVPN